MGHAAAAIEALAPGSGVVVSVATLFRTARDLEEACFSYIVDK